MANDKLTTYRAKRDFRQTREPSGQDAVKPTTRRRFVIQKHDATRPHHDLRLELDGVFKSWAVTKGAVACLTPRQAAGGRGRRIIRLAILAFGDRPFEIAVIVFRLDEYPLRASRRAFQKIHSESAGLRKKVEDHEIRFHGELARRTGVSPTTAWRTCVRHPGFGTARLAEPFESQRYTSSASSGGEFPAAIATDVPELDLCQIGCEPGPRQPSQGCGPQSKASSVSQGRAL